MPTNKQLEKTLTDFMEETTKTLKAYKPKEVVNEVVVETPVEPVAEKPVEEERFPVPEKYRKAVDDELNQDFGIKMDPMSDSPQFNLTIIVPDKYSTLTPDEKKMQKFDLRSKVIPYTASEAGVREWAAMVYGSFDMETRAKIQAERTYNAIEK